MNHYSTGLEDALADAFAQRAASLSDYLIPVVGELSDGDGPKHRGRTRLLVATVVVVATLVVIGATQRWNRDSSSPHPQPATNPTPELREPLDPPAGVMGPEVRLSTASSPGSDDLVRQQTLRSPGSSALVVQAEGSAPIVVTGTCVMIAAAPVSAAGYQGSCVAGDEAGTRLVGAIDTGPVTTPSSKTYGAWVAVPAGTAYVTFTYGTEHAWQRPIGGVSYFTIAGTTPPLGGEPVVLQAFGPDGALLGEARSRNWTDATGGWHWG